MRKLLVWLIALPLAVFALSAAAGSVTKLRNPQAALKTWPVPGLTYERLAQNDFSQRVGDELTEIESAYRPGDGELASRAVGREATAHYALGLLALRASASGDDARAREMFAILSRLDKRQSLANLWQLFDYGEREQLVPMMAAADRLFRHNVPARDRIMPGLATATALDGAIDAIDAELADDPPWRFQYWWALIRVPDAFDNGVDLRRRALSRGQDTPPGFDRAFLFALAEAGKLDQAQALAADLSDTKPARLSGNAPLTFDFTDAGGLPPFAWDVLSEGEYGAYHDPQLGELAINAIARSGGQVARRLIDLSAGRYTMTVQARLVNTRTPPVTISLRCANRARTRFAELALDERNSTISFSVPATDCDFGWIEIDAESVDDPEGYDIAIESIRLSPAS